MGDLLWMSVAVPGLFLQLQVYPGEKISL